jgi:hypothetical protein
MATNATGMDPKAVVKKAARAYAESAAELLKSRRDAAGESSPLKRAMTGNPRENTLQSIARGYVGAHDGDVDDTIDSLNETAQGIRLKRLGLTEDHVRSVGRDQ